MKKIKYFFLLFAVFAVIMKSTAQPGSSDYKVIWNSPGNDYKGSMPAGNGDIGFNLWVESGGDVILLLSKTDSWTENGQLVKLGRVRIHFSHPVFKTGPSFKQSLLPELGEIQLSGTSNARLRAWADANAPVIHLEFFCKQAIMATASTELWRMKPRETRNKGLELASQGTLRELYGIPDGSVVIDPDSVFSRTKHRITWMHHNTRSVYPLTFQNQHLNDLLPLYPDPLLNRIFGTVMESREMESTSDKTLTTHIAQKNILINLYSLTLQGPAEIWKATINQQINNNNHIPIAVARQKHQDWWRQFWGRSWINVSGNEDAKAVTQGYAMQRWMIGGSARGELPVKYNGGIFTVGHEPGTQEVYDPEKGQMDADFRGWGGNYWFQNNRLLYWPMIASGDHDLLRSFFGMYLRALPLAKDRVKAYYGHAGAAFPETINFWGLPNNNDFGWNNPSTLMTNNWIKRYVSGGLELTAMALSEYRYTNNTRFLTDTLLPLASAIITYYDQHYKRVGGKIRFDPAQAIETRQVAIDPSPDIAGLKFLLPDLLALPKKFTSATDRKMWFGMLSELPELPAGYTDSTGKQPEYSNQQYLKGKRILLDAAEFVKTKNVENPALYSIFPFTLYGLNLPDLELARNTYAARLFQTSTCWSQDGIQAAILGLTEIAKKEVVANFKAYGKERFKWFWAKGHDWEPDLDNGGAGQIALQNMLLQVRGDKMLLFPSWPKEWNVDFKLYAPDNTYIKCSYVGGSIKHLEVYPAKRKKDVVIINK